MQGFKIENDKEFFYRTTITISADAKNKTVLIRFNGVYSYARVFVNGQFVREHFGGGNILRLQCENLLIQLSTSTGQLLKADVNESNLLTASPRVVINKPKDPNTSYETIAITSGDYKTTDVSIDTSNKSKVIITTKGFAGNYPIKMTSSYGADGTIRINYEADSIPAQTWQIGIAFPTNNAIDKIQWNRKGYWTTYSSNHIAAIKGTAVR